MKLLTLTIISIKENISYLMSSISDSQDNENDLLLLRLDLEGISISTGSACTAGVVQVSHVLQSFYGDGSPRLHESVRVSISPQIQKRNDNTR